MKHTIEMSKTPQVGEVGEDGFSVYLIPETLRVTVLGKRQVGDTVNIEIDAQTQVLKFFRRNAQGCAPAPSRLLCKTGYMHSSLCVRQESSSSRFSR